VSLSVNTKQIVGSFLAQYPRGTGTVLFWIGAGSSSSLAFKDTYMKTAFFLQLKMGIYNMV